MGSQCRVLLRVLEAPYLAVCLARKQMPVRCHHSDPHRQGVGVLPDKHSILQRQQHQPHVHHLLAGNFERTERQLAAAGLQLDRAELQRLEVLHV